MILMIDDEIQVQDYADELMRRGCNVSLVRSITGAVALIQTPALELDAVVLDVMMPTEDVYDPEAADMGLKTGLLFLQTLRTRHPQCPVVILTNRTASIIEEIAEKDGKCTVFVKADILFDEFGDEVEALLKREEERKRGGGDG